MSKSFLSDSIQDGASFWNFIFIPLFFAFYIVFTAFNHEAYLLTDFEGRSISVATSEGLDIGKRVGLFYRAIAFAVFLIAVFTWMAERVRKFINETDLRIANGLSLGGLILLYFNTLGADMSASLHFIFASLLIVGLGAILHRVRRRIEQDTFVAFVWTILVSVSLYFFTWQVGFILLGKWPVSLPIFVALSGGLLYYQVTTRRRLSYRAVKSTRPLAFIPLIIFLSTELSLILNQHKIFISPAILFAVGILIMLFFCWRAYRRFANSEQGNLVNDLYGSWLPVFIPGLLGIAFFSQTVTVNVDLFEDANRILPLHQLFAFGKIPFLDKFNAHALADFGFGMLYSVLNGAHPLGGFVYGYLLGVLLLTFVYLLVYKITGNGILSVFFTLAFPYSAQLLPSYYGFVLIPVFFLVILIERQSVLRYFLFFTSVLFMPFWRIDLGASTLFAGAGILVLLALFNKDYSTNRKSLFKGLGYSVLLLLAAFVFALIISGKELFISMKDAFAYLSSFQSYGLKHLTYSIDLKYYSLYYVFPAVILIMLFSLIFNLHRGRYEGRDRLLAIAILFLGIFYFSNLQRGLVRHTLAEQWDMALTSYAFFIISAYVYLFFRKSNPAARILYFFIAGIIIITNYVFTPPDLKSNNVYNRLIVKAQSGMGVVGHEKRIDRVDDVSPQKFEEFISWFNKSYSDSSTFLDFSNTPMLYYYADRSVPNYFVQMPHTAHNDFLQERFLEDLKKYDIPIVVFSNMPTTFWDNLDGIPNSLRHYKIAEYIFRNYKPAFILGNHCIWIRKSEETKFALRELFDLSLADFSTTCITIASDSSMQSDCDKGVIRHEFKNRPSTAEGRLFVNAVIEAYNSGTIMLQLEDVNGNSDGSHKQIVELQTGKNEIYLRAGRVDSTKAIAYLSFQTSSGLRFRLTEISGRETDQYPDFYSQRVQNYNLKWIPSIWALDENYKKGNIESLLKLSGNVVMSLGETKSFNFTPLSDKGSGNYILISARNKSSEVSDLTLGYGEGDKRLGGFNFYLKNDTLFNDYLVRISSQYNWFAGNCNSISLTAHGSQVEIGKIEILKGD